jgi:hypothetical protein
VGDHDSYAGREGDQPVARTYKELLSHLDPEGVVKDRRRNQADFGKNVPEVKCGEAQHHNPSLDGIEALDPRLQHRLLVLYLQLAHHLHFLVGCPHLQYSC